MATVAGSQRPGVSVQLWPPPRSTFPSLLRRAAEGSSEQQPHTHALGPFLPSRFETDRLRYIGGVFRFMEHESRLLPHSTFLPYFRIITTTITRFFVFPFLSPWIRLLRRFVLRFVFRISGFFYSRACTSAVRRLLNVVFVRCARGARGRTRGAFK